MSQIKSKKKKAADYHHGDLRRTLLKEALKLLKSKSPKDLSLRDLARRIGVSHGAPYRHFSSQEALLAALAIEGFGIFADYLNLKHTVEEYKDDLERFRLMASGFLNFALKHPVHFKLMFTKIVVDHSEYPDMQIAGERAFGILLDTVSSLQESGAFRAQDPQATSIFIWSSLHGFCTLILDQALDFLEVESEQYELLIDSFFENMMSGLR